MGSSRIQSKPGVSTEQENLVPNRVRLFPERETAQGGMIGGVYLKKFVLDSSRGLLYWDSTANSSGGVSTTLPSRQV